MDYFGSCVVIEIVETARRLGLEELTEYICYEKWKAMLHAKYQC
jgi:hypothetical protein